MGEYRPRLSWVDSPRRMAIVCADCTYTDQSGTLAKVRAHAFTNLGHRVKMVITVITEVTYQPAEAVRAA